MEDNKLLPVLAQLTFDRLQKMSEVNVAGWTPERLVQEGLCDPIRLFVKGEPHKEKKLIEGRYRLIMSVSLIDQLVARVLFQRQNKTEIANWVKIPSKPGFGLSTDDQVELFVSSLAERVRAPVDDLLINYSNYLVSTDCSGFDWSVADWMLADEVEIRNDLTDGLSDLQKQLRKVWCYCISNSVVCLSDGRLFAQQEPGIQKSGSYNTSSSNSRIRVMCAFHCGADWAFAMGDDALESNTSDLGKYKDLGLKVEASGKLEFCSHVFEPTGLAIPVNQGKMFFKLFFGYEPECGNVEVLVNYLAACVSLQNELRHCPDSLSLLNRLVAVPVGQQNNSG